METRCGYSKMYEEALQLAAKVHRDQNREGGDVPHITHLVQVSHTLLRHGFSIDAAIAGLLHDIVEDQEYALTQIVRKFGQRAGEMVDALSERKVDEQGRKLPWGVRKWETWERLRRASDEAVAVKAADTLHDARDIALDVRRKGPEVWERFACGPGAVLMYYCQVFRIAYERLGYHPLVRELLGALDELWKVIAEVGVGDEAVSVGADGDWLQDRLPRVWNLPPPIILGNASSPDAV
jgi:(p)ppGpp synthase/HD superfamily hydrolase